MKAPELPFTTAPTSIFVLATENGKEVLRQALPSNVGAVGPAGADGAAGPPGTTGPVGPQGPPGGGGGGGQAGFSHVLTIYPGEPPFGLNGDLHIESGGINVNDDFSLWMAEYDLDGNDNYQTLDNLTIGDRMFLQFLDSTFIICKITALLTTADASLYGWTVHCYSVSKQPFVDSTPCRVLPNI